MNFITKQIEKKLGVDLNGDGVVGSGHRYGAAGGYHPHGHSGGGLINKIESFTHIDLNGDGRIGGQPHYPPIYGAYGSPPPPPNFHQPGGSGMINELEKATNIDLNHDGRIGGGPSNYPPNYQQYGGPSYPPSYGPYGGPLPPPPSNFHQPGGSAMINELEKATNIDLNGDGRIGGGQPNYPPNYQQYGGSPYPPSYGSYSGPPPSNFQQPGGSGMINELEKATNIDLNGDGRIGGGQPNYPPNYQQFGGPSYPSSYGPYGGPPPPSNFNQANAGSGMINELEKATNIDLNGDGRIGSGQPNYPPNYQQYGGSPYPPSYGSYSGPPPSNFQQPGGSGMINELEKATNIDLNGDGRIGGGQPNYPPNYQQYGGSPYPPSYGPYGGPPPPPSNFQQPGAGLINELEKATNIDLNGDGRIGGGQPNFSPNYNPYGYRH